MTTKEALIARFKNAAPGKRKVFETVDDTLATTLASRVPERYKALYFAALKKKASPLKAIRAKCQECCGYEDAITRIKECTAKRCPLWCYRPYQDELESGATEPDDDVLPAQ